MPGLRKASRAAQMAESFELDGLRVGVAELKPSLKPKMERDPQAPLEPGHQKK